MAAGPLSWVIIAITIGSPSGARIVPAGASDESGATTAGGSLRRAGRIARPWALQRTRECRSLRSSTRPWMRRTLATTPCIPRSTPRRLRRQGRRARWLTTSAWFPFRVARDLRHFEPREIDLSRNFDLQTEDRSLRCRLSPPNGGVMKLANHGGRLVLVRGDGIVDVADASGGRFSPDPQSIYERWDELLTWSAPSTATRPLDPGALDAPVPRPRQVFAIGLNYAGHAAEAGQELPVFPPTFTKFPTCLTGPDANVDAPQWIRRLGGGARARRRPARLRGRRGRRLVAHRRCHGRPRPLRAHRADPAAGAAVQPRQIVPRASARSDRGSSPPTSSPTRTTSRSVAR